jgi:DNA-binding Lrp family transcriptional regulator
MQRPLDATDRRLIAALDADPKASHARLARQLDIARGTVYSRLDRLEREGVITGYGPEIAPEAAGLGVLAFCTLEIAQGTHDETTSAIAAIDEVIEIHTVTGPGDLLCRIVARSNDHLHEVLQRITHIPSVRRSQSQLALATSLSRSVVHLVTR